MSNPEQRESAPTRLTTNYELILEMAYGEVPLRDMAIAARENDLPEEQERYLLAAEKAGFAAGRQYAGLTQNYHIS